MRMVIPFGCVYLGTGSVHPSPSGRSPEGVARLYLGIIRPPTRLQIQYVNVRLVGHPLACVSALRLLRTLRPHKGITCQPTSLLFRWCNCARRRRSALRLLCDRGILENIPICYILQLGSILSQIFNRLFVCWVRFVLGCLFYLLFSPL